ncbi:putative RNA-binding protein [Strigomonas culicis]|nr:putative RNA-binding protein [Strigomonas culicis]|eukprot:EPY36210.1 putative RNA-binding protein [Strigomonas culicis]
MPKVHNNEIGNVSNVVHMRNVTPDVTQLSIQTLAQNFGKIKHVVMLRQMNQALVEMETTKSAQELVDFFKTPGYAEIDGRRVYVRYSNHKNLTATHHTSRTLLVSMFNTEYDVSSAANITPEIVYRIFVNYGTVERIVVLPKNESSQWNHNRLQALVQFDTKETAENVKNTLQGQPVTLGETVTFTLDIQFSRMEEIKTTNPHTSLVVDEGGNTHRPITQAPVAEAEYGAQQWS